MHFYLNLLHMYNVIIEMCGKSLKYIITKVRIKSFPRFTIWTTTQQICQRPGFSPISAIKVLDSIILIVFSRTLKSSLWFSVTI